MSKYKDFEFIKTIKDFNEVDEDGWTHFHYICYHNYSNLKIIKYCIKNGADLNFQNIYKNIPFHFICGQKTNKKVLEYFLQNGTDLNIKNKFNNSPFNFICKYNKDLIKYCKPYINEYDFVKILKELNLNWKEYV